MNQLPPIASQKSAHDYLNDFRQGFGGAVNTAMSAPRMTAADKIQNPILRTVAQIPQDIVNSPSDLTIASGKIAKDSVTGAIANPVVAGGDLYNGLKPAATLVSTAYGAKALASGAKALMSPAMTSPTPAAGSIEQMTEQAGGWQPGMRKVFDTAMMNRDPQALKALLPQAPPQYVIKFAPDIIKILTQ